MISVIVGVLILSSSWILIRDAVDILLEGTPSHVNIVNLKNQLECVEGVGSVHDLHVWTLTSGVLAMSCHVVMAETVSNQNCRTPRREQRRARRFHIDHTTVQIEEPGARGSVRFLQLPLRRVGFSFLQVSS